MKHSLVNCVVFVIRGIGLHMAPSSRITKTFHQNLTNKIKLIIMVSWFVLISGMSISNWYENRSTRIKLANQKEEINWIEAGIIFSINNLEEIKSCQIDACRLELAMSSFFRDTFVASCRTKRPFHNGDKKRFSRKKCLKNVTAPERNIILKIKRS